MLYSTESNVTLDNGEGKDISQSYQADLDQLDRLAYWLDRSITLPGGIKIGLDSIVGLIPGIGDGITGVAGTWLFMKGRSLGVSKWTQIRMAKNLLIDFVFGSIPLIGDIFDVMFKANVKNIELIRKDIAKRAARK